MTASHIELSELVNPLSRMSRRHRQMYIWDIEPATARKPRRIHVRTPAQVADVPTLERSAVTQEYWVIAAMREIGAPVIPSELHARSKAEGHPWPLTSIRRTLSNLKDPDRMIVYARLERRRGPHGLEHEVALARWAR